jgi:glycosyltransferase involved in cell wall biosynthesis
MIRIGFFLTPNQSWMGGINYFRNLFFSITATKQSEFEILVIVPSNVDNNLLNLMIPPISGITVVKTKLLQRGHPLWLLWRTWRMLFDTDYIARLAVQQYCLNVISHSEFLQGGDVTVVNWIPDFQHIHLPQMFSTTELKRRILRYTELARKADLLIVSSEDARNDLLSTLPDVTHKARVLKFVSNVPKEYWLLEEQDRIKLLTKYQLPNDYFYVPNQFWKHKNHIILLNALKIIKNQGRRVNIVCSGFVNDNRNPEYFESFMKLVKENDCSDSLRILGIVPYMDVFALIRFSTAVINPSKFEGWSSTVEECKSVGKRMLLSKLNVHVEQSPLAKFFDPDDPQMLADLLCKTLFEKDIVVDSSIEDDNVLRIKKYGFEYLEIIRSAFNSSINHNN